MYEMKGMGGGLCGPEETGVSAVMRVSGAVGCVLLGSDSDSFSQSQTPPAVCSL